MELVWISTLTGRVLKSGRVADCDVKLERLDDRSATMKAGVLLLLAGFACARQIQSQSVTVRLTPALKLEHAPPISRIGPNAPP